MERFKPIVEGENLIKKEDLYEWMMDEAVRLDLPAIINMIALVGRWDEQIHEMNRNGYLSGNNTTYDSELS